MGPVVHFGVKASLGLSIIGVKASLGLSIIGVKHHWG